MDDRASQQPDGRWLSLIGIGEDGLAGLSDAAKARLLAAELVVGGKRHLTLAQDAIRGKPLAWPSPLSDAFAEILAHRGRPVAVLASGDPFFYGVGKQLVEIAPAEEIACFPQPSAFSLAAARLGWALQDAELVTLHGRPLEAIGRSLQPGARILALSWDGTTPSRLAALLTSRGFGAATLTVLECLGGPREHIRSAPANNMTLGQIDDLNTIAVALPGNVAVSTPHLASGLDDALFEHDGQLTKREARAVTLSSLAPRPGALLWDIGLGAGSVAIEWLLRHPSMRAIGVEAQDERARRAARNAAALGTPELRIVTGRAPDALSGLPPPDAVFVGGGLAEPGLFDAAWAALKPGGRLVANAVSLKTEQRVLDLHETHGGDLIRLDVARTSPIGRELGWAPHRPLVHWRVSKPC